LRADFWPREFHLGFSADFGAPLRREPMCQRFSDAPKAATPLSYSLALLCAKVLM